MLQWLTYFDIFASLPSLSTMLLTLPLRASVVTSSTVLVSFYPDRRMIWITTWWEDVNVTAPSTTRTAYALGLLVGG
jgi:hypothetical protein